MYFPLLRENATHVIKNMRIDHQCVAFCNAMSLSTEDNQQYPPFILNSFVRDVKKDSHTHTWFFWILELYGSTCWIAITSMVYDELSFANGDFLSLFPVMDPFVGPVAMVRDESRSPHHICTGTVPVVNHTRRDGNFARYSKLNGTERDRSTVQRDLVP